MTPEELKVRHQELHKSLDELFSCYITEHPDQVEFLDMEFRQLLTWSSTMAQNPTCAKHS